MENNTNNEIKMNDNLKEDDRAFGVVPKNEEQIPKNDAENLQVEENKTSENETNGNNENYDARNFEFGQGGGESIEPAPKQKSFFQNAKDNLKYVLSYTPALVYTGLSSLFCLIMMLFFISRRNASLNSATIMENHPEVITSYSILLYAFVVFLIIAGTLFISSIILNTIRCKQGKK